MRRGFAAFFIFCCTALTMTFVAGTASAAQQSLPNLSTLQSETRTKPVTYGYRRYCVRQYFKCRDRWGGGPRFRRCMKWRGCWDAYVEFRRRREYRQRHHYDDDYEDDRREGYSCRHWKDACAENWGYGNNDYYGCLKYYSCD